MNEFAISLCNSAHYGILRDGRSDYTRHPFFNYACLFASYCLQSCAENLHVVKANARDGANLRPLNDVSCVQSPAHATLEHRIVNFLLCKLQKSNHEHYLKESHIKLFLLNCIEDLSSVFDHILLRDKLLIDSDSFSERGNVRGYEQACLEASILQNSCSF